MFGFWSLAACCWLRPGDSTEQLALSVSPSLCRIMRLTEPVADSQKAVASSLTHYDGVLNFSGNNRLISSAVALQIPRSVIKPVTSLAGVTSNA